MFQRKAVSCLLAFLAVNAIVGTYGSPLPESSDSSQYTGTSAFARAVAEAERAQRGRRALAPESNFWTAMGDAWNRLAAAAEEKLEGAKNFVQKIKDAIANAVAEKIEEAKKKWEELKSEITEKLTTLDENLAKLETAVEEESEAAQKIIQELADKVKEIIDEIKDRLIDVLGILGDEAIEHINAGAEKYKNSIDEGVAAIKDGKADANQNVINVISQIRDAIQDVIDHLNNLWPSDTTAAAEVTSTCST